MSQIPSDLEAGLAKAGLSEFFADCTAAHQREYLKWIGEAKRPETRAARIAQAVKMIGDKRAKEALKSRVAKKT